MRSRRHAPIIASLFAGAVLLVSCASPAPTTPASRPPDTSAPAGRPETQAETADAFLQARSDMVRLHIEAAGISDEHVLRAMRAVPRHEFVPPEFLGQAYENHPLPIGFGQTISQPYIVAWMTELLELKPGQRVLEIGTGSGYQAAILAELGFIEVYSVEIVPELAELAQQRLMDLGYERVHVRQADGYYGWPEAAPFDAIIVTAAPDHLPAPLVDQLAPDGRIVVPIGPAGFYQSLWRFVKVEGELVAYNMGGVRFVPFTGAGIEAAPGNGPP